MSDETKTKLISFAKTFGTAFIVAAATTLVAADQIEWTLAFWGAVGTAGLRSAITALIAPFLPIKLGGKKV
ncbi:MAG: hypothetical protein WC648_01340 [Candidatus Paceibacterota bacterium]|jgi:hypothetical protein